MKRHINSIFIGIKRITVQEDQIFLQTNNKHLDAKTGLLVGLAAYAMNCVRYSAYYLTQDQKAKVMAVAAGKKRLPASEVFFQLQNRFEALCIGKHIGFSHLKLNRQFLSC